MNSKCFGYLVRHFNELTSLLPPCSNEFRRDRTCSVHAPPYIGMYINHVTYEHVEYKLYMIS